MKFIEVKSANVLDLHNAAMALESVAESVTVTPFDHSEVALESDDGAEKSKLQKLKDLIGRAVAWARDLASRVLNQLGKMAKAVMKFVDDKIGAAFRSIEKIGVFFNKTAKTQKWREQEMVNYLSEHLSDYEKAVCAVYCTSSGTVSSTGILDGIEQRFRPIESVIKNINSITPANVIDIRSINIGIDTITATNSLDNDNHTLKSLKDKVASDHSLREIIKIDLVDIKKDLEVWRRRAPGIFKKAEQLSTQFNSAVERMYAAINGAKVTEEMEVWSQMITANLKDIATLQAAVTEKLAGTEVKDAIRYHAALVNMLSILETAVDKYGKKEESK